MLIIHQLKQLVSVDNMIELLSDLYPFIITWMSISMTIGAIVWFIVIIIDRKQEDDFDKKYRESRRK